MNRIFIPVFLLILILTSACGGSPSPTINPEVLATTTPPPAPASGMATVTGQVIGSDKQPISHVVVRLAEVARGDNGKGGAYILDLARSPGTTADESGYFIFSDVKAGEYVIVVGDVEISGVYEIIKEADGQAKVWNFPANIVSDIGILSVSIILPTPIPTITPGPYPEPTAYPNP